MNPVLFFTHKKVNKKQVYLKTFVMKIRLKILILELWNVNQIILAPLGTVANHRIRFARGWVCLKKSLKNGVFFTGKKLKKRRRPKFQIFIAKIHLLPWQFCRQVVLQRWGRSILLGEPFWINDVKDFRGFLRKKFKNEALAVAKHEKRVE